MTGDAVTLDIEGIKRRIPHRYPMLLVDRVRDLVPGQSAVGIKNVTANEHFFEGHFPGKPVMPGVLTVEALAQTAAVLAAESMGEDSDGKVVYFMSITDVKFRRPIVPGDSIELHVEVEQARRRVWKFKGSAIVDGETAADARFMAMLADA